VSLGPPAKPVKPPGSSLEPAWETRFPPGFTHSVIGPLSRTPLSESHESLLVGPRLDAEASPALTPAEAELYEPDARDPSVMSLSRAANRPLVLRMPVRSGRKAGHESSENPAHGRNQVEK
jgi:hypothetical protein